MLQKVLNKSGITRVFCRLMRLLEMMRVSERQNYVLSMLMYLDTDIVHQIIIETLNYIYPCQWYIMSVAFTDRSDQARDKEADYRDLFPRSPIERKAKTTKYSRV
jgi:hypothetical protein